MKLQDAIAYGLFANRPTAGIPGRLYYTSDTGKVYRDNGASWDELSASATGPHVDWVTEQITWTAVETFYFDKCTAPGDQTARFPVGTKLYWNQTMGDKQGYVVSAVYEGGITTLTVVGGQFSLTTINWMKYSYASMPPGFTFWYTYPAPDSQPDDGSGFSTLEQVRFCASDRTCHLVFSVNIFDAGSAAGALNLRAPFPADVVTFNYFGSGQETLVTNKPLIVRMRSEQAVALSLADGSPTWVAGYQLQGSITYRF